MIRGKNGRPYLIAEIGGNHEGNFETAKHLCNLAINTDVDSVKFQLYRGDSLVNKKLSPDRNRHFKKFELTIDEHIYLAEMVKESGKNYSTSIWDLDFLPKLDKYLDYYKIGSGDLTNRYYLSKFLKNEKPIIISTGLSTFAEIEDCINFIRHQNEFYKEFGTLFILQCTSMYPILNSEANLNVIKKIASIDNVVVGYSDHTIGIDALVTSFAVGAELLEFHFTDIKEGKEFRDHLVSLTPADIKNLCDKLDDVTVLLGTGDKVPLLTEISSGHVDSFRRAVYLNKKLNAGSVIKEEDLVVLRPNNGISAISYFDIVGKQLLIDFEELEPLRWDLFK